MCCGLGLERSSCWCPHAYSLAPNQFIEKHLFIKSLSCCPAANETPAAPIDSCAPIYQQTTRGMWARACVRVCVCGSLIRPCSRCPESVWYSVGAQNCICWINEFSPEMEKLYNYITQEKLYNFSTLKKKKKKALSGSWKQSSLWQWFSGKQKWSLLGLSELLLGLWKKQFLKSPPHTHLNHSNLLCLVFYL